MGSATIDVEGGDRGTSPSNTSTTVVQDACAPDNVVIIPPGAQELLRASLRMPKDAAVVRIDGDYVVGAAVAGPVTVIATRSDTLWLVSHAGAVSLMRCVVRRMPYAHALCPMMSLSFRP